MLEPWHIWIFLITLSGVISFLAIQQYIISNSPHWLILTIMLYIFILYAYTKALTYHNSSYVYIISKIMGVIFVIIAGKIMYGQTISIKQWIGLIFGIMAIILLGK